MTSMLETLATAMGRMLPPLTEEQIVQIKNPEYTETKIWISVLEGFYPSLPVDYKEFLVNVSLYLAVGLENDDGLRKGFNDIMSRIHKYASEKEKNIETTPLIEEAKDVEIAKDSENQ